MSPLANGNPTAAELDDALKAEAAYDAAKAEGRDEQEAIAAAKVAIRANREARNLAWVESLGRGRC